MENQPKKILVVGDLIYDQYVFGKATRLCPEAPVPVLVPQGPEDMRLGGAGLVREQLREFGGVEIHSLYGSYSRKTRYVVDGHMLLRVDNDSYETHNVEKEIFSRFKQYDAIVISDYDKGTWNEKFAGDLLWQTRKFNDIPTFVDSKNNWDWFYGGTYFFPNEIELPKIDQVDSDTTIIKKCGARGATVQGIDFPPSRSHAVRDVSGAGDIFMAAFVYAKVVKGLGLAGSTIFANRVAGISVEHVGTHVVTEEELDKSYEV